MVLGYHCIQKMAVYPPVPPHNNGKKPKRAHTVSATDAEQAAVISVRSKDRLRAKTAVARIPYLACLASTFCSLGFFAVWATFPYPYRLMGRW